MQGAIHLFRSRGSLLRRAVLSHVRVAVADSATVVRPAALLPLRFFDSSAAASSSGARLEERGFESTTIADILKDKGKSADGSWLWCTTDDTVYDAVKSMTQNNVGALVVVKPGEEKSIAGIITERADVTKCIHCRNGIIKQHLTLQRQNSTVNDQMEMQLRVESLLQNYDYLRKIIVQGRSSKETKVGDIMTEENKLITVTPDTKVLQAMQLMTDKRIRHIPVIDSNGLAGMVSIGDVVRAVVSEHREELNRLNAYIQGGY